METSTSKHDAWLVSVDETRHYNIDPADLPYVEKICQVYLYDRNERTYCCELTPSYYLDPLYVNIDFTPDTPDDLRDSLQAKYCFEPADGAYMHARIVERFPAERKHQIGSVESLDEAREDAQSNCRL
jgi:hypothetical protein